jgi:UDP-N-acetylmuramate--alanine ligase
MALVTPVEPVALDELGRVHFAGIGGAGMSGIARIMLARGVIVSGSDAAASPMLDSLAELGADIHLGHSADHVEKADTLVVSSAIREDNPELEAARARGIRILHRAAALASVMLGRRVIAVAGTHGKTTTTSMITTVFRGVGTDPGYVIGGVLAETGVGAADGAGRDFVAEADESDGSFLMLSPHAAVITNIDADHLDNYGTPARYRAAFDAFATRVESNGLIVLNADDPGTTELAANLRGAPPRVRTYGESPDADYQLTDVVQDGMRTRLTVTAENTPFGSIQASLVIGVPGRHHASNAAAAFTTAVELGIAPQRAATALGGYRGAARRLERKGEAGGVTVLDTYAHHPTELAADLRAARGIVGNEGRVIAVFQPHLYSRTRIFADQFAEALRLADVAVVLDVYAAREDPEPGVSGALIAGAVPGSHFIPDITTLPGLIATIASPGDLVLTMGAGDVTRQGPVILQALAEAQQ